MTQKFGIGQPVSRFEDPVLVTGRGRYSADISVPGMAHAHFLRSPHAHARITAIDASAARSAPGVLAVLTAAEAEADGLGDIPCGAPLTNRDGTPLREANRPLLARGKVRHVGEAVALVVAESVNEARDAADLIAVDYEILPAVVDAAEAVAEDAPQLFDHVTGNLSFDWENGDRAATDSAFARAHHVTRIELVNNRIVVNAMETRPALADYEAATDTTILYSPTQSVHGIRRPLAEAVVKFDRRKLRCITPQVGGGFGMKGALYPEQCLLVWASRKLKRAIKYEPARGEAFLSDCQGRDQVSTAELALDAEGRFLGLRTTTYANMGAYTTAGGPGVPTRSTDMLVGLYKTPAVYANVKGVVTNTVPVSAYRGAGRPEAAYLVERLVDQAARDMGLAQDQIRRRNFIQDHEIPYRTPLGDVYDSGEFEAMMDAAMEKADWPGFPARRAAAKARGKLRGIGMATYIERCGGGGREIVNVAFNDDETVTLVMGTQENGQGHWTSYAQIMADRLDIPIDRIALLQGDTARTPPGFTGGSRSVPMGGAAIAGAAEKIIEKGRIMAGHLMETAAEDIEYADGTFRIAGTDRAMSIFELAREVKGARDLPHGLEPTLDETNAHLAQAPTFPNGCHIVEVEIDPETGMTEILRYTVVDDFGDVVNPLLLAGQVHGGIVQGLGQALFEHTVYEHGSGQLLAGSFMDYGMPRAGDAPFFSFDTRNVACTTNPLGIKGAGEAGAIGAPPAIMNAIMDAIEAVAPGARLDMPAIPSAVFSALRKAEAA